MRKWIFALIQFAPLSFFATYAFWSGAPDDHRWEAAFKLASVAALVQFAVILPQRRPVNRLVLAANIYLLLGGLAFLTRQWWYLELYESLRESAIFALMLAVGAVATLTTRAGYVGLVDAPRNVVVRTSAVLLGATVMALIFSIAFRGDRYLAAVWPIIGLAVLQRLLVHHVSRTSPAAAPNPLHGSRASGVSGPSPSSDINRGGPA